MRIGILALVLIFFLSGVKNLRDARAGEKSEFTRRKLLFGILMMVVGALVLIYYFVSR